MTDPPPTRPLTLRLALIGLLLLGVILRWAQFPKPGQPPQIDELGYMSGGLTLLEGITPGYKFAPAGPTTWLGWAYAGTEAAKNLIMPGPEERAVPIQVRPFVAVNHALFDLYRDFSGLQHFIVIFNIVLSVIAICAAFKIGASRAGISGAILLGGVATALPLFVEYACTAFPYSSAWSFAIIAWYFASAYRGKRREFFTSIVLGLSIASRIDMLAVLPLILWEFWNRPEPGRLLTSLARVAFCSLLIAQFCAPWLLMNLIGNLRVIATVRFSPPPFQPPTFMQTLTGFAWLQGLGPLVVLFLGGIVLTRKGNRAVNVSAGAYVFLLLASMLKGSGYGIRHDAAAVIALIVVSSCFVSAWQRRWKWIDASLIGLALVLPLVQCVLFIIHFHSTYVPEDVTTWIENHVPPGTRLYWAVESSLRTPLPTQASADLICREVNDESAWQLKFQAGLARFNLNADQLPRALSQENLIQEQSGRRMWFILGSRTNLPTPRYDIRLLKSSPIFGVRDLSAALNETGGVVVWRGEFNDKPAILGDPIIQWTGSHSSDVSGVYVFATPDVREKLTR